MARCSLLSVLRSKNDWPHSLMGFGNLDVSASAAGEKTDGDTDVPTNGVRSGMVRPELHAGEVIVCVGYNVNEAGGRHFASVSLKPPKKKHLARHDGPAECAAELIAPQAV